MENQEKNIDDALDLVERAEEAVKKQAGELSPGTYTHRFSSPFEWMGKTYEELAFDFGKLRGRDALAIYLELAYKGIPVYGPRSSPQYLVRMASRACGLGADAFDAMPLRDFEAIIGRAKAFLPLSVLI